MALIVQHLLVHPPDGNEPQQPVDSAKLAAVVKRYLSDRRIAAGKEEKARHGPWNAMGHRKMNRAPFKGNPPRFVSEEDFFGKRDVILDLWKQHEDDSTDDERFRYILEKARALLKKDPRDIQARFLEAMSLKELGQEEKSLRLFNQVIRDRPGFWKARLEKGILLSDMFRFDEALEVFDQAHAITEDWEIYLNRGIALCFAGRFDESEWDLWKAVEGDPADGNAYYDLAWVHAQRREPKVAVEMLRFSARDKTLLTRRISRATLIFDRFMGPIKDDPVFQAYLVLLPTHDLVIERRWRTLSNTNERCSILEKLLRLRKDCPNPPSLSAPSPPATR